MPCVLFGSPLWVSSFLYNLFKTTVEVSCAFPLCVSQKIDGYFRMNDKALFGGQVGVHPGEFSEYSFISHGKFPALE